MPVLRLTSQKPPTEFVQETLRRTNPKLEKLVPLSQLPQLSGKERKLPEEFVGALTGEHFGRLRELAHRRRRSLSVHCGKGRA